MSGIYVTEDPRFTEKGRLWRVVGPESQENFVLGTIHVDSNYKSASRDKKAGFKVH